MAELAAIAPGRFREVLGGYPTGVCVITSSDADSRYGMVVGSFTSISLAPPLLDDAIAWIECDIAKVAEIGDHLLVAGNVSAPYRRDDGDPPLFFSGSYHGLQPRVQK